MTSTTKAALALCALLGAAGISRAEACEQRDFDGADFTVCEASGSADLRLFLRGPDGQPWATFGRLDEALRAEGAKLAFAMNAGMYHEDRSPVGHYIEDGREEMRVIPNEGPGNFGLLPNGIFCIRPHRADVIETRAYLDRAPDCTHATQSGPMLVIDGELHPRFLPDSTSRYIRNGVGTSADGDRVVFAISNEPVTFHHFARLFRDALGLPQALFFDGNVSRLYDAASGRSDFGRPMGPIVGLVVPAG